MAIKAVKPTKAKNPVIKNWNVGLEVNLRKRWVKFCKERNSLQRLTALALEEFMELTLLVEATARPEGNE